jgi:chemotaxis protein CheD
MASEIQYYHCMMQPGYVVVSEDPTLLCTVCGNGVVMVLWDRLKKTGGMAHCVFPRARWGERPTNLHADMAVASLIKQMADTTDNSDYWEAQIFGGGNARGFQERRARKTVKVIKKILKEFSIELVSEDVGGSLGRKVVFNTFSGDVMLNKTRRVRKIDWMPEYGLT